MPDRPRSGGSGSGGSDSKEGSGSGSEGGGGSGSTVTELAVISSSTTESSAKPNAAKRIFITYEGGDGSSIKRLYKVILYLIQKLGLQDFSND